MISTLGVLLVLAAAPDGGVTVSAAYAVDGGLPAARPIGATELRLELVEVKAQLQRQTAALDSLTTQVEKLAKVVNQLRADQQAAEDKREEAARQATQRRNEHEQAVSGLVKAELLLSSGNTNVKDALAIAEAAFGPAGQRALQAVRQALANGDLGTARNALLFAIQAEATRVP